MILFIPPAGTAVPHTTDVLIGDGAGGISDGGVAVVAQNSGFSTDKVLQVTNNSGNVLGVQNLGTGYAAIPFITTAGKECGAVGAAADGSMVYIESSAPTGQGYPPNLRFFFTSTDHPGVNGDRLVFEGGATGNSLFKSQGDFNAITIDSDGLTTVQWKTGFGHVLKDTRSDGFSSVRFLDHTDTEKLAIGNFNNSGNQYVSYKGTLNFFAGTNSSVDQSGNWTLGGSVTIGGGAPIAKVLTGTVADAGTATGSVTAGGYAVCAITVTGAATGDKVAWSTPGAVCTNGLVVSEIVVTADVVNIYFFNTDLLTAHTPGAQPIFVEVIKN